MITKPIITIINEATIAMNSEVSGTKMICWLTSEKFTVINPDEGEAKYPVGGVTEKA